MPQARRTETRVIVVTVRFAGQSEPFVCDGDDAALAVSAGVVESHYQVTVRTWKELNDFVRSPDNDLGLKITTTNIWTAEYSAVEELDLANTAAPERT